MRARLDPATGPPARARALQRFAPLLLDRGALERFLERATLLMPGGNVASALAVRDGGRETVFPSLRDVAADPDLRARVDDVALSVVRTADGDVTHEVRLRDDDGRATLLVLGDELWAYGALGVLSELLAIYARPSARAPLGSTLTLNCFSFGFALAVVLFAGLHRSPTGAVAAALVCGAVWFCLDLALSEMRLALTPPLPRPLTIEIRSQRDATDRGAVGARLWLGLRLLAIPVWIAAGYVVLFIVLPRVAKVW